MPRSTRSNRTVTAALMRTKSQQALSGPKKNLFRRASALLITVDNTVGLGPVVRACDGGLFATKHILIVNINGPARYPGGVEAICSNQILHIIPQRAGIAVEIEIGLGLVMKKKRLPPAGRFFFEIVQILDPAVR